MCLILPMSCRWSGVREWLFLQRAQAEVQFCHREGGSLHQQLRGNPHGWERWENWRKTAWRWKTRRTLWQWFALWGLSEIAAWLAENGPISVALNAFAMQVSSIVATQSTYTATVNSFHTLPWPLWEKRVTICGILCSSTRKAFLTPGRSSAIPGWLTTLFCLWDTENVSIDCLCGFLFFAVCSHIPDKYVCLFRKWYSILGHQKQLGRGLRRGGNFQLYTISQCSMMLV